MSRRVHFANRRNGAIIVLLAFMLPVTALLSALVVNVAYMNLSRTELQIATDSAARAGGRILSTSGDKDQVRLFARDAASRNLVTGQPLLLADTDFEFGRSTRNSLASKYTFTPDEAEPVPNALRVTGRRSNGSATGPVSMFMPSLIGATEFEPVHSAINTQLELDIAIVIDRSGSMAYSDDEESGVVFPPPSAPAGWDFGDPAPADSRWFDAVAAVNAFLDEMAATPLTENVALVTYAETPTLNVELTSDYASIVAGLSPLTAAFNGGSTNIGGGINKGLVAFSGMEARPWATKAIILLTDGIHYTGTNPISAAYAAKSNSVIVYTVTFSDEADQYQMGRVASKTAGMHLHAATGADLVQAFRDIANSLPTMLTR
jgi:Ca-activated chloride channel family protein